ncbi:MAG: hypothetical protein E6248_01735 [Clostridium sp.]|uniref:hypothetical protein n=1 Tax=Clostridium sp. TaxID=1506 RepID=UPI00290BE304|nr:hypothetical protein [Clostridium sp.]MDU5109141.1 hypothetical protein [Clostridium sp.]
MANILIKFSIVLILLTNLFTSVANADINNLKQCFYIISAEEKSRDLYEDLNLFKEKEIPVFVVIDPNENIDKKVIDLLKVFQDDINLGIILEDVKNIENSYFAVKGYDKKLKISGLCNIEENKLLYIGESNLSFDLINIDIDPLKTISEVKAEREDDSNYALVVDSDNFNISTLLLANNELKGVELDTSNYSLRLKEPTFMDKIVVYVGYINIVIFSISIIIFIAAIIIFKKWSMERFLD